MIGRLIRTLMRCEAELIVVVANKRMPKLVEYLEELKEVEGLPLDIRAIVSPSSYYTLKQGSEGLSGRFIAMTVDTIFPVLEFKQFVIATDQIGADEVLMGLTRYVDDESPLYARIGDEGLVIDYRYGGEPFPGEPIVSAGIYGLTSTVMELVDRRPNEPESLSDFQRILAAETEVKVKVFEFSKAMDVDRSHDWVVAERFIDDFENNNI